MTWDWEQITRWAMEASSLLILLRLWHSFGAIANEQKNLRADQSETREKVRDLRSRIERIEAKPA